MRWGGRRSLLGVDTQYCDLAGGVGEARCYAVRTGRTADGTAAVRRLNRHGAWSHAAIVDVARTDLRARRGEAKDFRAWRARRLPRASGPAEVVHNSFSYHLTPGGFMMESGAHALGCAVIPAGTGNTEQQVAAIAHFQPTGYLGTPDFLKVLLDAAAEQAGEDASSRCGARLGVGARRCQCRCARNWLRAARGCANATPLPTSA